MPPNPDFFHHDPSLSIPPPPAHVPADDARPGSCGTVATDARTRRSFLREDSHHADHPHHVAVWREVRGRAAADWRMIEIEMRRDELILLAEQGFPLTDAEAALCAPVGRG